MKEANGLDGDSEMNLARGRGTEEGLRRTHDCG